MHLGNPCTIQYKEFFAIFVTIGDGKKALFWEALWLYGRRPKYIGPSSSNAQNATDASSTRR
jgi:hypothetical protein